MRRHFRAGLNENVGNQEQREGFSPILTSDLVKECL